jgi:hypothetical protein
LVAEPLKAGERSEKAEPFRSSADIAQKNNLLSDLIFKDHKDVLLNFPKTHEQWFAFESEKLREYIEK